MFKEHIAETELLTCQMSNAREQRPKLARLMAMRELKPAITANSVHVRLQNIAATELSMMENHVTLQQAMECHAHLLTAQAALTVLLVAVR
jgi:hypothetical protein